MIRFCTDGCQNAALKCQFQSSFCLKEQQHNSHNIPVKAHNHYQLWCIAHHDQNIDSLQYTAAFLANVPDFMLLMLFFIFQYTKRSERSSTARPDRHVWRPQGGGGQPLRPPRLQPGLDSVILCAGIWWWFCDSAQVKIFCDKGAERKLRDEERRAAKRRMTPSGKRRLDEMYHESFERWRTMHCNAALLRHLITPDPVLRHQEMGCSRHF